MSLGGFVAPFTGLVPVLDEPLEYLVAEEFELAGAGSPVRGDDTFPSPGSDHLI